MLGGWLSSDQAWRTGTRFSKSLRATLGVVSFFQVVRFFGEIFVFALLENDLLCVLPCLFWRVFFKLRENLEI